MPSRWPKGVKAPDFLTFGTTRVVGRQPHTPAAFTSRGIPGTHFLEGELTPGHMVLSVSTRKFPMTDATGIRYFLKYLCKIRKASISFVLSVCPHTTTRLPMTEFSSKFTFDYFKKICLETAPLVKI